MAGVMLLSACGGGDDTDDAASADTDTDTDTAASADIDDAAEESGSDSSADGKIGSGSTPGGSIELGETYTVVIDPAAAPFALTIPEGSVTDITFEAAASNQAPASLNSTDFTVNLAAQPGGTAEDGVQIVTARGGEQMLSLAVSGFPDDTVNFRVDSSPQPDDPDGGDAPDIITDAIPVDGTISGLLGGDDQADYFTFDVADGASIAVSLSSSANEQSGGVRASLEYNGESRSSASASPGGTEEMVLVTSSEEGGEWFVQVSGSGAYTLDVAAVAQTDGGGTGDAGESAVDAVSVEPGAVNGLLGGSDDSDFFDFEIPAGAAITIGITTDPTGDGSVNARILLNGDEEVRVAAAPGGTESKTVVLPNDASSTGVIEVWGGAAAYEIDLTVGQQEDGGTSGDAGADAASAKRVDPGTFSGQMSGDDSSDFYVMTIDEPGPVVVNLGVDATATRAFNARVLVNGSEIARVGVEAGGSGDIEGVTIDEATGDIVIELWSGIGGYTITVTPSGA